MQIYEIRVLDENGKTQLIAAEVGLNDSAVIRSGRTMAAGKQFEVWRGTNCIYGVEHPSSLVQSHAVRIDLNPP
jgi:hypothetical protein